MAAITKSKTLVYKKVGFLHGHADFQAMLLSAMAKRPRATAREMEYHDDSSLLLNTFRKQVGVASCGVIVRFTRGNNQPVVAMDPNATELNVTQLAPPGAGDEFIENLGFFAAYKSHLIISQSASVRSGSIEDYLNWFFRYSAGVLPKDDGLTLEDSPTPAFKAGAKMKGVKNLRFFSPVWSEPKADDKAHQQAGTVDLKSQQWKGLRQMLAGIGIKFHDIPVSAQEAEAVRLEVNISIDKRHFLGESELLDQLGTVFRRDGYDDDYEVELTDGTKIRGKDLTISKSIRVDAAGGVPSIAGMFTVMSDYFDELIKSGSI